jgi:hypothetical protein
MRPLVEKGLEIAPNLVTATCDESVGLRVSA